MREVSDDPIKRKVLFFNCKTFEFSCSVIFGHEMLQMLGYLSSFLPCLWRRWAPRERCSWGTPGGKENNLIIGGHLTFRDLNCIMQYVRTYGGEVMHCSANRRTLGLMESVERHKIELRACEKRKIFEHTVYFIFSSNTAWVVAWPQPEVIIRTLNKTTHARNTVILVTFTK